MTRSKFIFLFLPLAVVVLSTAVGLLLYFCKPAVTLLPWLALLAIPLLIIAEVSARRAAIQKRPTRKEAGSED